MTEEKEATERLIDRRERHADYPPDEPFDDPVLSPDETLRLVHDLRTHQIELEMQNEELRRTQQELTESRDRYSDLYDFAPVGYVTANKKGVILAANLTMARMLGVDRSRLLRQSLPAFIVPEDQDIFFRHRRRVLESNRRDTCRVRLLSGNGALLYVDMDSIPTAADNPEMSGLRIVISDVTERTQIETKRQEFEEQLQRAQKLQSLGLLAGGIAHDFNNLLMAIMGNSDLARITVPVNSPAQEFLEEIEKACHCAAELSNQMLSYSGFGSFTTENINISRLVSEMGHMLEVSISKKATLRYALAEKPVHVEGDDSRIRQVVINLITNASEAIGDYEGMVVLSSGKMHCDRAFLNGVHGVLRASLSKPLPEGEYAYLKVTDTGCGMDAETVDKVFDPFFTTKFDGRGIGMSAVLGIIRGHNGAVKVESVPGKGSSFTVLFPVALALEDMSTPATRDAANEGSWCAEGTVLLVDDDEAVRNVGEAMLRQIGFTVLTVSNGREALRVFSKHASELTCVLLDLTMPQMDGEETFIEMRRLQPDATVILCSGYTRKAVAERFANRGLAGFIQKPFQLGTLTAHLRQALEA